MPKRSRLYDFSKEEIQNALDNSTGYINALKVLGIGGSSSYKTLLKIIDEYNLSIEKLNQNRLLSMNKGRRIYSIPLSQILVENSTYQNMKRLKIRLMNEGYKENKCECCGIHDWNGKPLVLQIHHINGKHNDNCIENLQILCPNCHSQTDNFCGANIK